MRKKSLGITGAMALLLSCILLTLLGVRGGQWYWVRIIEARKLESKYFVTKIIQTGSEKNALPTFYLSQLLELAADRPVSLYSIDVRRAQEMLLSSPCIKEARVIRQFPDTLYIDYTVRRPVALLGDFVNAAVDKEGVVFPLAPFYSPKNLVEIVLGLGVSTLEWDRKPQIDMERLKEAFSVIEKVGEADLGDYQLVKLDMTQCKQKSYGKREIDLIFYPGENCPLHYVRLPTLQIESRLANLAKLIEQNEKLKLDKKSVIDLRLDGLAYVEQEDE
ncbi:MAG: Cell division protein FtsQ [Chlamydiia bacterium]|nr:Cell division protein FtsQ [Chlamydiia bacterium]